MILIRKAKSACKLIKQRIDWNKAAKLIRQDTKCKDVAAVNAGKAVVLMPHSDDEWIGCSCLLQDDSIDTLIVNMDMPGGDSEALHRERYEEAKAVSKKYGSRFVTVDNDKEKSLEDILREECPEIVFLPCYLDWHSEHYKTMDILEKCLGSYNRELLVAMYQVSLPIPADMINAGYRMTKRRLDSKWKNLKKYYPTQKFLPVKRFKLNEYINGAVAGSYALEAYVIMPAAVWRQEYHKCALNESNKQYFKNHLQDISLVRAALMQHLETVGE